MNKFMVRLFAVVLSVMMLGTVAFAATAEITGGAIAGSEFKTEYADNTVKTVLAYKATSADDTTYTAEDIIALDQAANVASISINAADVDADFIVVLYGGNAGITDKAVINLSGAEEFDVIECATALELVAESGNIKRYENVAVAKKVFAAPTKTVEKYGFKWIKDGVETDNEVVGEAGTLIEGGGDVEFGVVMAGVPEGVVIYAKPFVTYAD